ncbi:MAG: winged helix-turn-helix domain-containing protein [Terriglobia bacterium]
MNATTHDTGPGTPNADERVRRVRFGIYELDLAARELLRRGARVKLQQKPFQILEILVERAGELVTRKDLREKLWPDTFVGFDRSLNTAVNSLRRALGDSPAEPRFIETRSREGYRFIIPVEKLGQTAGTRAGDSGSQSIAVLPFRNSTGESEMDYLSDGISEAIINALSRLPEVRVMARSTVFRYRGQEVDPQIVGQDLNVRVLLTGELRSRGGALEVTVELVDTLRGWRLWGKDFSRDRQSVFEVEADIAREVSQQLRLRLTAEERNGLGRHYTENSDAYRSYLRGRYQLNRTTVDGLDKSLVHFDEALAADPGFALPYAARAEACALFAYFGLRPAREVMPLAEEAARRALEIDPNLPEAHASLAGILKAYHWEWKLAAERYEQALRLNPNYATGRRWYADYLAALGRHEDADREMQHALELDPFSLVIHTEVGWNAYMARNGERAMDQSLKTLEMEPRFSPAHHVLGLAYELAGKHKESVESLQLAAEHSAGNPIALASLARALAVAGRRAEARKILAALGKDSSKTYVPPYIYAVLYLGLGERERALDYIETAFNHRDVWLVWILCDPRLDAIRTDPRFSEILRGMNLEHPGAA